MTTKKTNSGTKKAKHAAAAAVKAQKKAAARKAKAQKKADKAAVAATDLINQKAAVRTAQKAVTQAKTAENKLKKVEKKAS